MDIKKSTPDNNEWVDGSEADPRFPTRPEFVLVAALAERYNLSEAQILELARTHSGACLRSDGNPWVDHGSADRTLYFHEPTLRTALGENSL